MFQLPSWVPYSVRAAWDQRRILRAVAGLDRTPPMPACGEGADAEVHMLLCHRDVRLGVLALKSLLRHAGGRFSVALTDDGSLAAAERTWVDRHVPGARWFPRRVELGGTLDRRPRLAALYASPYPCAPKLLHPILLARSERVIVLDPDTAFFARPDRLLDWAKGEAGHAWYMHDHQNEAETVPAVTREAFADLAAKITPPGRAWRMDYFFFNSGLLAFRPAACDLDAAEAYLEWRAAAPPEYLAGKSAIWFGEWTPEQTCFLAMFALMAPPAQPLGDRYRIGGDPGYTFNHFLRSHLVKPQSLAMLRGLVNELAAVPEPNP